MLSRYFSLSRIRPSAIWMILAVLLLSCGREEQAGTAALRTGVTSLKIDRRILLGEGVSFGAAGPYEVLSGKIFYQLDPTDPINLRVVDAALAADDDGLVRYSADFVIVKPVHPERGNGALLYNVVNRGGFDSRVLEAGPWAAVAGSASGSGERMGRLMKQGWTVAMSGWQDDLLSPDLLRLYAPLATENGENIPGPVLSEIESGDSTTVAYLGASGHRAYPVAPGTERSAELRIHESYADPGTLIPRDQWRFARFDSAGKEIPDREHIYYPAAFQPNRMYTVGYTTDFTPLMSLCFPAVRDFVSLLSSSDTLNPLRDSDGNSTLRFRLGYGSSQCGRYLRNFIYDGFNRSVNGGRVFDGVFANVPGSRRGFFNYRHSQPSRSAGFYPEFVFPFTDLPQTDPVSGITGGIQSNLPDSLLPRVFYIHHTGEYWSSGAGLTHASLDGLSDAPLPENVRIYTFAGTAHGHARLVDGHPEENGYYLPFNPNHAALIEGPLLEALGRWVMFGESPPQSRYPRIDAGELVPLESYEYPSVPDVEAPVMADLHPRWDWGQNWRDGILKRALPGAGPLWPVFVPAAGLDGNELGGINTPHVAVPVASYVGWNYPAKTFAGAENTVTSKLSGAWLPFSATRAERKARGDSRKSLDMLYNGRGDYLDKLRKACEELVDRGLMFSEDTDMVLEQGGAMYDFVSSNGAWRPGGQWGEAGK